MFEQWCHVFTSPSKVDPCQSCRYIKQLHIIDRALSLQPRVSVRIQFTIQGLTMAYQPPPSCFPIHPLHPFTGPCPSLHRPTELTTFSYDIHRRLHHDTSSRRWYWPARLGAHLSQGFNKFVKHDDSVDEHLDGLLAALVMTEKNSGKRCTAEFVTWRGMMTKVRLEILSKVFWVLVRGIWAEAEMCADYVPPVRSSK